jgi:hypothetical protein
MSLWIPRLSTALTLALLSVNALADDCAPVKSAMLNSGHKAHSTITTTTDSQGKRRLLVRCRQ